MKYSYLSWNQLGVVLLSGEVSIKVICEKVKFQTVIFAIIFVTINGHTSKLFQNIFHDFQTEDKREIITALYACLTTLQIAF